MALFLGEMLIQAGAITNEHLKMALETQKKEDSEGKEHRKLGKILVEAEYIEEDKLYQFLANKFSMELVDLSLYEDIPSNILDTIPAKIAKKLKVIPIDVLGQSLSVVICDPGERTKIVGDLQFRTGLEIEVMLAAETQISGALEKFYQDTSKVSDEIADFETSILEGDVLIEEEEEESEMEVQASVENSPMQKFVRGIITKAVNRGVSDIHIEVFEKILRVRYRLDGMLIPEGKPLTAKFKNNVAAVVKSMAHLRIDEKRVPQDGRIKMRIGGREVDFRVSTLPCIHGEKIVMRILDKSNLMLDLTKLGFEPNQLKYFDKAIASPWGMILITGPTGSGKTTTLYSALSNLNKTSVNIMTAEDPVEYNLKGINQVQIHHDIGMTFEAALKSFLRQDPDIIMVGEIRDFPVAETAIKAALTGHLVLSTLHTNDAPSSITRLVDIGIEPFLVASSTVLVMAQRLVRQICPKCIEPTVIPEAELEKLNFSPEELEGATMMKGKGCAFCSDKGYKGRIAIYEIMPITEEIREMITNNATALDLKKKAMANGMATLHKSARIKFLRGETTLEEVLRVTGSGEGEIG
ncbi:Flp pilus assembly complex ATPase component TadA [bacterium]|nr:Flp pilus assembly complex ATPase component TadA [bacterium]